MQVNYTLGEADAVEFSLYHNRHSPAARRNVAWVYVLLLCLILVYTGNAVRHANSSREVFSSIVSWSVMGAGLMVFCRVLLRRLTSRNVRNQLRESANQTLGPRAVTISPEAIRETTTYSDCRYYWPSVVRIVTTASYAFFFLSAFSAILLPRRAFASDADFEAFVAEARRLAAAAGSTPMTPAGAAAAGPMEMDMGGAGAANGRTVRSYPQARPITRGDS